WTPRSATRNCTPSSSRRAEAMRGAVGLWPVLSFALLTGAPCALAEDAGVAWDQLSANQQQLLGRFQSRWMDLPAEQRARLAAGASRWDCLAPEARAQARERFRRWRQLTPEQRQRLIERRQLRRRKGTGP
ncbi:MAG: DUF3106 domain-containing protein, partial [Chloroflexota bacterium]